MHRHGFANNDGFRLQARWGVEHCVLGVKWHTLNRPVSECSSRRELETLNEPPPAFPGVSLSAIVSGNHGYRGGPRGVSQWVALWGKGKQTELDTCL